MNTLSEVLLRNACWGGGGCSVVTTTFVPPHFSGYSVVFKRNPRTAIDYEEQNTIAVLPIAVPWKNPRLGKGAPGRC